MTDLTKGRRKNHVSRYLILMIILGLALLHAACATVPLTGRTQLSLISTPTLNQMALTEYQEVLAKSKLSTNKTEVAMVRRVGNRIARATEQFLRENGLGDEISGYKWEFNLIQDDKTINAWCMPGGKVAVYTGLLPVAQNETGLAVVMGHEIAHALAQHGRERMSQGLLAQLGGIALAVAVAEEPAATQNIFMAAYGVGVQVGVLLPYSRQHEYEADRIGLTLMAMAGYDPREAVPFWQRMAAKSEGSKPPEFLSTHPVSENRIAAIENYMPEAMARYKK